MILYGLQILRYISAEKLLACPHVMWLSRVPETIKACSQLISIKSEDIIWT